MIKLSDLEKLTTKKKKKLREGTYIAEVTFCDFDQRYLNDSAIQVKYKLEDDTGNTYNFSEIIEYRLSNPRTAAFLNHLASIGIDIESFQDFVGVREKFELKRTFYKGSSVLSIDNATRCVI